LKSVLLGFVVLLTQVSFSQDSTKQWQFKKQVDFWSKWQTHGMFAKVSMPSYLKYHRINSCPIGLPTTFDSITDNPLRHGASYVAIKTETAYKNRIILFADLYAEHRGVSYGVFDRNNTVVFPVMRIELKDSLQLFKHTVHLSGKIGEFLDEKLDEGLTIYNLDVQGFQINAHYKNFILQYTVYGDLYNGIGLDIDDADHFSLQKKLKNNASIGVSILVARPPYAPLENNFNINLFGSKIFTGVEWYGQFAYRPFEANVLGGGGFSKKSAMVTGAKISGQNKKFNHFLKAEARYYGFLFNFGYYNWDTVLYRRPATDINSNYANTVGHYLYPLRKCDTPFSQWAVFTEYNGSTVWSIGVSGNSTYHCSKKFDAFVEYDFNYINSHLDKVFSDPERNSSFFYPFINAGLSYKPAENTFIKASLTNKAMNLDLNYPTFYLLKRTCFQVSVFAFFK
jgi:hypothetical protein